MVRLGFARMSSGSARLGWLPARSAQLGLARAGLAYMFMYSHIWPDMACISPYVDIYDHMWPHGNI